MATRSSGPGRSTAPTVSPDSAIRIYTGIFEFSPGQVYRYFKNGFDSDTMPSRRRLLGVSVGTVATLAGCFGGVSERGDSAFRSDRLSVPEEYTPVAETDVDVDDEPGTVSKLARAFERPSDHPSEFAPDRVHRTFLRRVGTRGVRGGP